MQTCSVIEPVAVSTILEPKVYFFALTEFHRPACSGHMDRHSTKPTGHPEGNGATRQSEERYVLHLMPANTLVRRGERRLVIGRNENWLGNLCLLSGFTALEPIPFGNYHEGFLPIGADSSSSMPW